MSQILRPYFHHSRKNVFVARIKGLKSKGTPAFLWQQYSTTRQSQSKYIDPIYNNAEKTPLLKTAELVNCDQYQPPSMLYLGTLTTEIIFSLLSTAQQNFK